ncbi:hypothetical protein LJC40_06990 [Synergistaceae bacterium OttesenSCG-928-D05]|nr:hypothetical protein [Synergistaceae bacterium OttesenSCG-928-D05]
MQRRSRIRVIGFIVLAIALMFSASSAFADTVSIGTPEQLAAFRDRVNGGEPELDALLTADILLSGDWKPIGYDDGTDDYSYAGTFDGGGFTITGLKVTVDSAVTFEDGKAAGLFGVVGTEGVVQNVTIQGANVDAGTDEGYAGAAVGLNSGTVKDVAVIGGTMKGSYTGGVVGYSYMIDAKAKVLNCSASDIDSIDAVKYAGGVVGNNDLSEVTNCTASGIGTIKGEAAGGIVGSDSAGNIANCTVSRIGTIEGVGAGGIVGGSSGGIANCTASDIVTISGTNAGGAAGQLIGGTITNCTASGIVTVSGGTYAGGVVGELWGGVISNCTASGIGTIDGEYAGGVLGASVDFYPYKITNCTASEIGTISGDYAGGIVGGAGDDAVKDLHFSNCVLLPRAAGDTKIIGVENQTGGVIGYLSRPEERLEFVQNCFFPLPGVTFVNNDENRPIGNVPLGEMIEENAVGSYNPDVPDSTLPAILARFLEGVTLQLKLGESVLFDVTGIPGTKGLAEAIFTWGVEDEGIASITTGTLVGPRVMLTGVALGETVVTCSVRSDALSADLTCKVTVVDPNAPTPPKDRRGGSSSNCGTLPGVFALFALAALPFVKKGK